MKVQRALLAVVLLGLTPMEIQVEPKPFTLMSQVAGAMRGAFRGVRGGVKPGSFGRSRPGSRTASRAGSTTSLTNQNLNPAIRLQALADDLRVKAGDLRPLQKGTDLAAVPQRPPRKIDLIKAKLAGAQATQENIPLKDVQVKPPTKETGAIPKVPRR